MGLIDADPGACCPACGARLGRRVGCQAAFEELSARAWADPTRASLHNLVVDTYAMQHPEEYCRSAKSYAAHLTGLCFAIEGDGGREEYWAIARWLDGRVTLTRPEDVAFRGSMTIADVLGLSEPQEYAAQVRAWASGVWIAYAAHHALAHEWLNAARNQASRARRPVRR
jgi:hypothetical protein